MNNITHIFIILFISGLCYVNTLHGTFVFDDVEAVLKNQDLNLDSSISNVFYHDFWGTNITSETSHKSYRPLTVLLYRLNVYLNNTTKNPYWYHFTNILLYMIICALLYVLLINFLLNKSIAFKCALLFGIHPIHTEVVASIVGQSDLLCSLFYFLTLLAYKRVLTTNSISFYCLTLLFSTVSMFCKETGITVLGICVIYDTFLALKYSRIDRKYLLRESGLIITVLLLLYVRWKVMNFAQPIFQPTDNPASFATNKLTRILSYNYIYFLNILLLLWPQWLCFDWSMGCLSLLENLTDLRFIFVLLFWTSITIVIYTQITKRSPIISGAIVFSLVSFLPASNLCLRVGFVIAERTLFLPSVGYCLLIVSGHNRLVQVSKTKKYKTICNCLFFGLCAVFVLRTRYRCNNWLNEYDLFQSGLDVCPGNAKVHYNVAKVAADRNDVKLAEIEYRRAIQLHPAYDQAMNNLGNLLRDSGQLDEAKQLLTQAIQLKPDFAAAWMNLGIVLATLNQNEESEKCYLTALKHRRNYADCYYNLGNLYLKLNRNEEALTAWRQAVTIKPEHSAAWSNILVLLDSLGQYEQVVQFGHKALNSCRTSGTIHFTLASTLGKLKRWHEAERHFEYAIKFNPNNALYYSNFGVLYHRWGKLNEAKHLYEQALKINPQLTSALTNLNKLTI